jgi:hypothetical protein
MSNSLNLLLVIIALVLCEFSYGPVKLILIHHSVAAVAWFAVSSCLGANLRRSLGSQRRYTPGTSWRGMDTTGQQEWDLDDIRSSRLR